MTATTLPFPQIPSRKPWGFGKWLGWLIAVMALPALVAAGSTWFIVSIRSKPVFGPVSLAGSKFTLAPGVTLNALPGNRALVRHEIRDYAIDAKGGMVVRTKSGIFDLTSGQQIGPHLYEVEDQIDSMAVVDPGSLVVTASYQGLGTWTDRGFEPLLPEFNAISVFAGGTASQLFLTRKEYDSDTATATDGLYSLAEGQALKAEAGSPQQITAVTTDEVSTLFATGGAIFRLIASGQPVMLMRMPDSEPVVGLASIDGAVYFSTRENLYALGQDVAVPIVLGLGGKMSPAPGGLIVLDQHLGWPVQVNLEQQENPTADGNE